MEKGTFGDNLRREREMRGVSLDEIATATRIATRFLEAIENEQWDRLPGGVFNRGFVRAVAHYLGLDEESIVAEYALAVGDGHTVPVWTGSPPKVTPVHPWLAWVVAAILVGALTAGGWFGARRLFVWRTERRVNRDALSGAPLLPQQMPANTDPIANANPASSSLSSDGSSSGTSSSGASSSTSPPAISPGTVSAAASPDAFELKVEADKKTKVTVDADTDRVFQGTMNAGENRTFAAKDRFKISARDAGALQLKLNGKTIAPIGRAGRAGKATLTREALKEAPGGGN